MVVGEQGRVAMRTELVLRFDYGSIVPWVQPPRQDGTLRAIAGPDMVILRSPIPVHGEAMTTVGEFTVAAGDACRSCSPTAPSHPRAARDADPEKALEAPRRSGASGRSTHARRRDTAMPSCAR